MNEVDGWRIFENFGRLILISAFQVVDIFI